MLFAEDVSVAPTRAIAVDNINPHHQQSATSSPNVLGCIRAVRGCTSVRDAGGILTPMALSERSLVVAALGRRRVSEYSYGTATVSCLRGAHQNRYNFFMLTPTEKIWHNGRFIPWSEATVHVLAHVVSYGSSVFEGIRCYETPGGPAVFRMKEHIRRLCDSAKIYRVEKLGYSAEQLGEAMLELVRVNRMDSCYIKPVVMRGYGDVGVNGISNPIEIYIACWNWGKYLGEEALSEGVDV